MQLVPSIKKEFSESMEVLQQFVNNNENILQISNAAAIMVDCIKQGGKIISCGNGGSHCDAMHFAEELTGRYREKRRALPAIAIADPSYLTCVSNDFGYANVFTRFLEAVGNPGDVLLAISTSGFSENIISAVDCAKAHHMKVVILTGKDGGSLKEKGDIMIMVPHSGFADRIQEMHIKIIHALIFSIEQLLFGKK